VVVTIVWSVSGDIAAALGASETSRTINSNPETAARNQVRDLSFVG
jgi:hypothetical protein